jgi:hypothetical protein
MDGQFSFYGPAHRKTSDGIVSKMSVSLQRYNTLNVMCCNILGFARPSAVEQLAVLRRFVTAAVANGRRTVCMLQGAGSAHFCG